MLRSKVRLIACARACGLVAIAAVLAAGVTALLPRQEPSIFFLTAVLLSAVLGDRTAGVVASVLSVLALDFLFVPPRFSLRVTDPEEVVLLLVFLLVAAIGSNLATRLRRQSEATRDLGAIRREQQKVEAIMESIDDGLLVLDPSGIVMHVNEVASAILALERSEMLGRHFESLGTHHSHYLRLRAAIRELLRAPEGVVVPVELATFLRGRDHFYVLHHSPLRGMGDGPAGLILVLQDVTHLRDQEARREHLMATLSHELRTPLTSLRMAGELLTRTPPELSDQQVGLVTTVREDVARLEDLAQRLLDLSRARAMSIALEHCPVALGEVMTRVERLFALQAKEHGVTLAAKPPPEGVRVDGDATKLTWALSNLVANALRYTPSGGRVTLAVATTGDTVQITVTDTGRGIPAEQRERIFDRFVQGTGGDEAGAAGLGLAIVRDIVQAHGGRIYVESEVGQGSRFALELPRGDGSTWPTS